MRPYGSGEPNHAGRGPRNDELTDTRLQEEICERLIREPALDCSDVSIQVEAGRVQLAGTVPNRRMKHAIEDLVDGCPGVQVIQNDIGVRQI